LFHSLSPSRSILFFNRDTHTAGSAGHHTQLPNRCLLHSNPAFQFCNFANLFLRHLSNFITIRFTGTFSNFAAFTNNVAAGGVFVINENDLSLNTVITTGMISPCWSFVLALNCLQNSMILTPFCRARTHRRRWISLTCRNLKFDKTRNLLCHSTCLTLWITKYSDYFSILLVKIKFYRCLSTKILTITFTLSFSKFTPWTNPLKLLNGHLLPSLLRQHGREYRRLCLFFCSILPMRRRTSSGCNAAGLFLSGTNPITDGASRITWFVSLSNIASTRMYPGKSSLLSTFFPILNFKHFFWRN